jgi:hypothetical protein
MISSGVRIFDRLRDMIAWGVVAAAVVAWILIEGSSLREALAVVAVGGAVALLMVIIGNRVSGRGSLGRVKAVALAGADLIVRGDRGVRARRLASRPVAPSSPIPSLTPSGLAVTTTTRSGSASKNAASSRPSVGKLAVHRTVPSRASDVTR